MNQIYIVRPAAGYGRSGIVSNITPFDDLDKAILYLDKNRWQIIEEFDIGVRGGKKINKPERAVVQKRLGLDLI